VRTAILVILGAILAPMPTEAGSEVLETARQASVTVRAGDGAGSGVVFKNGQTTFVWTAAHVLPEIRTVRTVIDPKTGLPRVDVAFDDAYVVSEVVEDGRKVGEDRRLAQVVRYDEVQDLALLLVRQRDFGKAGVKFAAGIPSVGDGVWHVGSFRGTKGAGSVSEGVVSAIGRLRRDGAPTDVSRPLVSDQYALVVHKGSSGGGVFSKSSGECLGLVDEFLDAAKDGMSYGAGLIVPARRIREYAEKVGAKCAVESDVPIPENLLAGPVNTSPIDLPKDWRVPEQEVVVPLSWLCPLDPFFAFLDKIKLQLKPKKS
jgi:S1-C subfamily serine protease